MLLMFSITTIFTGCSPSEKENSGNVTPDEINARYISQMTGGEDARMLYEDGLIIKGLGNSSVDIDDFFGAFQIEYNENQRVKRVLEADHSFKKSDGFNFDLNEFNSVDIFTYNYSNNRLSSISSESGKLDQEFVYDDKGRVKKHIRYRYGDPTDFTEYTYTYDDNGKIVEYYKIQSWSGDTEFGEIVTDGKVNPFYYFWNKHSLIMPGDISDIMDNNLSFYPHNILEVYDGAELDFKARIEYREDYPHIYEEYDLGLYDNEPILIRYLD